MEVVDTRWEEQSSKTRQHSGSSQFKKQKKNKTKKASDTHIPAGDEDNMYMDTEKTLPCTFAQWSQSI